MSTIKSILLFLVRIAVLLFVGWSAYDIRMYAIRTFGLVIHEFDPWFNFRAAQYLADNGYARFFKWFDYMSWSPLGRPVGTTIYPGMQIASVTIWRVLNFLGMEMSLNDVCCYTPVYFGVVATMLLGTLTYIATRSVNAGILAAAVMSIIPAHIMRSVGGGYDNESVAISAMCLTFLAWCYSLSGSVKDGSKGSFFGIITGLAYVCMVAAWGGYIFVLNMIGLHAFVLVLLGRFNNRLYWAYTLWYLVGTAGAIQIPVVGWSPLKSLEQLAPAGVFIIIQLLQLCESKALLRFFKIESSESMTWVQKARVRGQVFSLAGVVLAVVIAMLWPTGYFGPLSSRIRGLFVTHTRTGNPLVDSVAEHQPASPQAFWQFLHLTCYTAPVGFAIAFFNSVIKPYFKPNPDAESTDPLLFIAQYAVVSYHFSTKMNRLMLLMGPISAALTGIALSVMLDFIWSEFTEVLSSFSKAPESAEVAEDAPVGVSSSGSKLSKKKEGKDGKEGKAKVPSSSSSVTDMIESKISEINSFSFMRGLYKLLAAYFIYAGVKNIPQFYEYCQQMGVGLSNPSLMFQARMHDGTPVMVDDYREAYWWLRDNTPEDARVMAWWDYGYQITGIGNRTTIADGNTWNHEHIALLGRCLTSPEKKAHNIIKHLADYVLIWTGGGGDDLAKSPHMARIANSVFDDVCPHDPLCQHFGFVNRQMTPTPMMGASLLYKLHSNRVVPGVVVDNTLFREVFMSRFNKVRIYEVVGVSKTSKEYSSNPANRICDAPGSWYCSGQYPPALEKILAKKKAFAQLEDFNVKKDDKAAKYHEEYMKRMNGQGPARP